MEQYTRRQLRFEFKLSKQTQIYKRMAGRLARRKIVLQGGNTVG